MQSFSCQILTLPYNDLDFIMSERYEKGNIENPLTPGVSLLLDHSPMPTRYISGLYAPWSPQSPLVEEFRSIDWRQTMFAEVV